MEEALHVSVLVLEQRDGDEPVGVLRRIAGVVEALQPVGDRAAVLFQIFEDRVRRGPSAKGDGGKREGEREEARGGRQEV